MRLEQIEKRPLHVENRAAMLKWNNVSEGTRKSLEWENERCICWRLELACLLCEWVGVRRTLPPWHNQLAANSAHNPLPLSKCRIFARPSPQQCHSIFSYMIQAIESNGYARTIVNSARERDRVSESERERREGGETNLIWYKLRFIQVENAANHIQSFVYHLAEKTYSTQWKIEQLKPVGKGLTKDTKEKNKLNNQKRYIWEKNLNLAEPI